MSFIHKNGITSILYNYNSYKEKDIIGRWVRHQQLSEYLNKMRRSNQVSIENIGKSFQGREINLLQIGSGKTKVFFWSQMHGDESTSTRAILDLLNFLTSNDDNNRIKEKILENITLFLIPMLNPDGAEIFSRRNAQIIDINRDAVSQQSPEAKILYKTKNEIEPEFGFNLHDQSSGYSVGRDYKSSTISLLAPPINYNFEINDTVSKAMKVVLSIKKDLDNLIPGHTAKYDDEFEPRAFGDNFAKDGVATVLIEAGGWHKDPQREYVRKIFFAALIKSLLTISDKSYETEILEDYNSIPQNNENLYELVLRNISIKKSLDEDYKIDIAIKHEDLPCRKKQKPLVKGMIADIGDLSTFCGYEDHNLKGFYLVDPGVSEKVDPTENDATELLRQGIAFAKPIKITTHLAQICQ